MKILVTGFNRFGKLDFNPTEQMMDEVRSFARTLDGCELVTAVLETAFEASGRELRELISAHDPDAVLGFGVARRSTGFRLERFALNIDDAREPDNAGWAPAGVPIAPEGPAAYASTLPLDVLFRALERAGVPVDYSNHAGSYVCNHVFYLALHHLALERRDRPCGFIHVPMTMSPADSASKDPSTPPSVTAGVLVCIEALRQALAPKGA